MQAPPLPVALLREFGLDPAGLARLDAAQLTALTRTHPAIIDWYLLLSAHARAAGGHLALSKRFLFNPQRHRDEVGIGDKPLVSNRKGTTGMDESILDRLTRMRREHMLGALRAASIGGRPPNEFPVDGVDVVSPAGLTGLPESPAVAVPPIRGRGRARKDGRPLFERQVSGE
jgi:hypothetical protein